jgi:hypothetical protein
MHASQFPHNPQSRPLSFVHAGTLNPLWTRPRMLAVEYREGGMWGLHSVSPGSLGSLGLPHMAKSCFGAFLFFFSCLLISHARFFALPV